MSLVREEDTLSLNSNLADIAEVTTITTVADVAGSLGGTHFLLSSPTTDYYVWLDTGASVDPAVGGRTGIQVVIVAGDSANIVATKVAAAIAANADFNAPPPGANIITVTNVGIGDVADAADVDSGFGFGIVDGADGAPFEINCHGIDWAMHGSVINVIGGAPDAKITYGIKNGDYSIVESNGWVSPVHTVDS